MIMYLGFFAARDVNIYTGGGWIQLAQGGVP